MRSGARSRASASPPRLPRASCAVRPRGAPATAPGRRGCGRAHRRPRVRRGPIALTSPPRGRRGRERGPSPRGCAQAFNQSASVTVRGRAERGVSRVQIITTPVPSCVIRFQLLEQASPHRAGAVVRGIPASAGTSRSAGPGSSRARTRSGVRPADGDRARCAMPPQLRSATDRRELPGRVERGPAAGRPHPCARRSPPRSRRSRAACTSRRGTVRASPGMADTPALSRSSDHHGHTLLVSGAWHSQRSADWGTHQGRRPRGRWDAERRRRRRRPAHAPHPEAAPGRSPRTPLWIRRCTREIGATGWAGGFKLHDTHGRGDPTLREAGRADPERPRL